MARRTLRAFENAAGMSSGMRRYQEMGMPVRDLEADQILIFDVLKQTGLKTLNIAFYTDKTTFGLKSLLSADRIRGNFLQMAQARSSI